MHTAAPWELLCPPSLNKDSTSSAYDQSRDESLAALVGDPNVSIHEGKAFVCNVEKA
jgi:hypothetical protein